MITIQWISITEINDAIRWMVIYLVDSGIQGLNNLGLIFIKRQIWRMASFFWFKSNLADNNSQIFIKTQIATKIKTQIARKERPTSIFS